MATSLFTKLFKCFGKPPPSNELEESARRKAAILADTLPVEEATLADTPFQEGSKVAIVGAGLAGLTAAYYLTKEGYDVTVFEAREEIGGRVKTLSGFVPNRLVEAGAELIGLNHPMWLTLARRFGLSLSVVTPEADFTGAGLFLPMQINGQALSHSQQEQLYQDMDKAYVSLNQHAATLDADRPWRSPNSLSWDNMNVESWIKQQQCSPLVEAALTHSLENDQTVSVKRQSYLGLLAAVKGGAMSQNLHLLNAPSEYWTQTEVFRCANGNDALARALRDNAQSYSGTFQLRLGTPVVRVDAMKQPVVFTRTTQEQFDWIVIAVPPPVYRHIRITGMQWPQIQCGDAVKYLSRVINRFWIQQDLAPSGAHDEIGSFWEGTDNQIADGNEFDLSLFSGGTAAAKVAQLHAQQSLNAEIDTVLPKFVAASQQNTFVDWPHEAWIETGYSCPAIGEVTTTAKILNQRHNRLVFAGEHTSTAFFGYMEGALQSGRRAAIQITGHRISI